MNTDQTPPPEVTPPTGHEILTPKFLRKFGAVEGMKYRFKDRSRFCDNWALWHTLGLFKLELHPDFEFSAPTDTMAARLTPALKFHNPDNLESAGEPPWRFLVEGEEKQGGDEHWFRADQVWNPIGSAGTLLSKTYRTRRPLSQKGGDELCPIAGNQDSGSNAAPTFDPDARPWLEIAEYDREKHPAEVECKWASGLCRGDQRLTRWNGAFWTSETESFAFNPPTHFRLPAPSMPTSGTPMAFVRDALLDSASLIDHLGGNGKLPRKAVERLDEIQRELASVTAELERRTIRLTMQSVTDGMKEGQEADQEKSLNRKLRAEIRVLWQRLRDANRGAECNSRIAHAKMDEVSELRKSIKEQERKTNDLFLNISSQLDTALAQRDTALRELAELKAKGDRL